MNRYRIPALGLLALALAGCDGAVGGADYSTTYDFHEFYAVSDGRPFRVVVSGNPFPGLAPDDMKARLLPVLQANKPRPRLTFTYDAAAGRPDYRLVLLFDAAPDLTAMRVCNGEFRHRPEPSRKFDVFAVYCRNEDPLSQTTGSTQAASPEDPGVAALMRGILLTVFTEFPPNRRMAPFLFLPGQR
jgi:hypothetical protein